MSVPDDVRRDAERTGALIRKKLMAIMDLQGEIDTLLRGDQPTPFGSEKGRYASLEALQRFVARTAIQFLLFEPVGWVEGNEELKIAADEVMKILSAQLKTLKTRRSDR
jgi:hypothetical protein